MGLKRPNHVQNYPCDRRNCGSWAKFQICELGAPVTSKHEVVSFLRAAERGAYPALRTINLFGSPLSHTKRLGAYGYVSAKQPGGKGYLFDHFRPSR